MLGIARTCPDQDMPAGLQGCYLDHDWGTAAMACQLPDNSDLHASAHSGAPKFPLISMLTRTAQRHQSMQSTLMRGSMTAVQPCKI